MAASPAARSMKVFAIYLWATALTLLVMPDVLLQLFGFPPTSDVWIRVVGMLVSFLGVYYWIGARTEDGPLFRGSVLCRASVPVFFLIFVLSGWVGWPLMIFGAVDLAGALWTWSALRSQPA